MPRDALLAAVGAGVRSSTSAARCASACPSRPTTRRSGTRCRAGTGTWSAPTAVSAANDLIIDGHPRRHAHRRARARLPGRRAARRHRRGAGRRRRQVRRARRAHHRADDPPRRAPRRCRRARRARLRARLRDHRRRPGGRASAPGHRGRRGRRRRWSAAAGASSSTTARPYRGADSGVPGVGEAGAHWLAERGVHAAGADTIAFERLAPGGGPRRCCRRTGCSWSSTASTSSRRSTWRSWPTAGVHEFTFVLVPLNIFGATGSPVRPLAVTSA